jgi:hypothetical protein
MLVVIGIQIGVDFTLYSYFMGWLIFGLYVSTLSHTQLRTLSLTSNEHQLRSADIHMHTEPPIDNLKVSVGRCHLYVNLFCTHVGLKI